MTFLKTHQSAIIFYGFMGLFVLSILSIGISQSLLAYVPGVIMLFGFIVFGKSCAKHIGRVFMRQYAGAFYLLLALLALIWSSIFWSVLPDISISRASKLTFLITSGVGFLYVLTIYQSYMRDIAGKLFLDDVTLKILGMATICAYGIALIALLLITYHMVDPKYRLSDMNKSLAVLLLLSLPWVLMRLTGVKKGLFYTNMALASVICLAICLSYTASQSVLISAFAVVILFILQRFLKWQILVYLCAGIWIFFAICFPWAMYVWGNDMLHFIASNDTLLQYKAIGYPFARLEIWTGTASLIADRPIFGYGVNVFREQILPVEPLFMAGNTQLHPHNFISQFWFEFGVFGAIWMVAAIAYVFHILAQSKTQIHLAGFYLINLVLLQLSVSHGVWQSWNVGFLFFLTGYIVLIHKPVGQTNDR